MPATDTAPQPKTGPQSQNTPQPGGSGFASGITDLTGFGAPRKGDYKTYREIGADPTVSLAVAIICQPIIRSSMSWQTKADKAKPDDDSGATESRGVLEDRKKFIAELFDPQRPQIVRDALKAVPMGYAGFEKVWGAKAGMQTVSLKPLAWEKTKIRADKTGAFAGLDNTANEKTVTLDKQHAFIFTHDPECGNLYGRSRFENIRKWWCRGEEVAERFAQYLKKASGIVFQLHYPDSGTALDAAGAARPNWWLAKDLLEKVSRGENVALPNKFSAMLSDASGMVTAAAIEKALAAAGKSDWVFSFLDAKGPDLAPGFLETLAYIDKLKFRGLLRPERTALEAQRGGIGHGDAEQHSEVGMLDTEALAADFTHEFNLNVVDDVLVANYGETARGSVWADPVPLLDTTAENAFKMISAAMASPALGPLLFPIIDWKSLFDDVEIPILATAAKSGITFQMPNVAAKMGVVPSAEPSQPKPAKTPGVVKTMSRASVRRAARELMLCGADVATMSAADDADGHWVTIHGHPVKITNGIITHGPDNMIGKTHAEMMHPAEIERRFKAIVSNATSGDPPQKAKVDLAPVTNSEAAEIQAKTGIDVSGYKHVADHSGVRHIWSEHGPVGENDSSLVPLNESDLLKIPSVIQNHDEVSAGDITPQGQPTIVYRKRVNGHFIYVEEVRGKDRQELAPKTMYKKKA